LSQKEEEIKDLNAKIQEKRTRARRDRLNRAEAAEVKVRELERSLTEKEQEVATLSARANAMQDNLSVLDGIGPKVSALLRFAGITSFSRLASTGIDRINEVLEKENPNLLRLTDPSTWPEQARMAAEGDWEALSALQNELKNARRTREPSEDEDTR
jgi:predicted flap endonuclease-1-like 5' DNA nuclease